MSDQDRYRGEIFKYAEYKLEFSLLAECDTVGESSISRSHGSETAFLPTKQKSTRLYLHFGRNLAVFTPAMVPKHSKNTITWQTSV